MDSIFSGGPRRSLGLPLFEFNLDPAMIARPPFLRPVEGTHGKRVSESSGGEDVIQLAGGGRRLLAVGMKCGDVPAVPWQFVRPRIGLAAVRRFRTDAGQPHSLHPIEHSLVPGGPVGVAMFAVTAQDIQIAGGQNAMPVRLRNENRQVGNDVVNGTVRKYEVVLRQSLRAKPLRIHRDSQHRGA